MDWQEFTQEVRRREAGIISGKLDLPTGGERLFDARLQHAVEGLVTESAELLTALKASKYYGKPLDWVNLKEEAGDMCFFLSMLLDCLGVSLDGVLQANVDKLRARYGDSFSSEKAVNRNLSVERNALEKRLKSMCFFCERPIQCDTSFEHNGNLYCDEECAAMANVYAKPLVDNKDLVFGEQKDEWQPEKVSGLVDFARGLFTEVSHEVHAQPSPDSQP
jgi:NTP pyrophosphatase (non-canonical NTP hydrolase)